MEDLLLRKLSREPDDLCFLIFRGLLDADTLSRFDADPPISADVLRLVGWPSSSLSPLLTKADMDFDVILTSPTSNSLADFAVAEAVVSLSCDGEIASVTMTAHSSTPGFAS